MGEYDFDVATIALGRRFLAVAKWTPPGGGGRMRGSIADPEYADAVLWMPSDRDDWARGGAGRPVPDLRDPGTLGCIEALMMEVWGEDAHLVALLGGGWRLEGRRIATAAAAPRGPTRAAALVAALEAAGEGR